MFSVFIWGFIFGVIFIVIILNFDYDCYFCKIVLGIMVVMVGLSVLLVG